AQITANVTNLTAGGVDVVTKRDGSSADEIETVRVKATAGTFTLTFDDGTTHTTSDLNAGIAALDLQTALRNLLGGGANFNVTLTDTNLYTITFVGTQAHTNVKQLTADTSKTVGGERSFFLKTGTGGTSIDAKASASGTDLNFEAKVGPFGLFVKNGSVSLGGEIHIGLLDATGNGRLVLLGYGNSGVFTDLGRIGAFLGISSTTAAILRDGGPSVNEVAAVTVIGTGGNFTISVDGTPTSNIAYGASDSAVAAAIGSLNVDVVKVGATYLLTFKGSKAAKHVEVDASGTGITGTAPDITFTNAAPGHLGNFAWLDLPISVGTQSFQVPIDFLDGSPGTDADGQGVTATTPTQGVDGVSDEIQQVAVTVLAANCPDASKCKYQLVFGDESTAGIEYNATTTAVKSALEQLPSIGTGNVLVTSGGAGIYLVHFTGTLAKKNVADMAAEGNLGDRDNHLRAKLKIRLAPLLKGDLGNAFSFTFELPGWDTFNFQVPSIFALLSDPGMVIDGLDGVFGAIQDALNGQ